MPKDDLNGIYLLYGEETYLIEKAIKNIKKTFGELIPGINYIRNRCREFRYAYYKYRNSCFWVS